MGVISRPSSRWVVLLSCVATCALGQTVRAQDLAVGEGRVVSKTSLYSDTDHTDIITTALDAEVAAPGGVELSAHFLVDVVSTASVDLVSSATPSFSENRFEGGLRVAIPLAVDVGLAYTRSAENDWSSHAAQVSFGKELAQKNTRLNAALGVVFNKVGRSGDSVFLQTLRAQTLELSISQMWDAKTVFGLSYTLQTSQGWHSSPYRFVSIDGGRFTVPERHPDTRFRHAMTVRARRYIFPDTGALATYRIYADDWGVFSHTFSFAFIYAPQKKWELSARARLYLQDGANFWRRNYSTLLTYVSDDRELSTFWDVLGGVKAATRVGSFGIDGKLDVIFYRFLDFRRLAARRALVASAGVSYQW